MAIEPEPVRVRAEADPLVNQHMDKGTITLLEKIYGPLFRATPYNETTLDSSSKYEQKFKFYGELREKLELGISELKDAKREDIGSVLKLFKDKLLAIETADKSDTKDVISAYMAVIHRTAANVADAEIRAALKVKDGLEIGAITDADESSLPEVFNGVISDLSGETPTRIERFSGALYLARLIETILPKPDLSS